MVEPLGNSVQVPYTPCSHCVDEVREGSVQSNHSELTSDFYTPCFLCTEVVREGSRRFEGVEPLGNSLQVPYTSCYHCEDEIREGSVQSNHSELTSKTYTHLSFSALKWFEKVEPFGNSVQVPYTPCSQVPISLQVTTQQLVINKPFVKPSKLPKLIF